MSSESCGVEFTGKLAQRIANGEIVRLAHIFWNPKTEKIEIYFPDSITPEEATALLRQYGFWPDDFNPPIVRPIEELGK